MKAKKNASSASKSPTAKPAKKPAEPEKIKAKDYDKEIKKLHVELVKLQEWVVHKGL
jgi:polyphosphate kinase 2 (PPK2 family)